jgi:hypothetical protein
MPDAVLSGQGGIMNQGELIESHRQEIETEIAWMETTLKQALYLKEELAKSRARVEYLEVSIMELVSKT